MPAIGSHHTAVVDEPWDGPGAVADAPNSATVLRHMHAWYSGSGPDQKSSYKFPHHHPTATGAAVIAGVRNALARVSQADIPAGDRAGVEAHLNTHMNDYKGSQGAELPQDVRAGRAAASGQPSGQARMHRFPGQIRATLINRDGRNFYQVEGYASVFNVEYEMWDAFGPYTESVAPDAFDKSLANGPDVAFLVNHKGVTMARTTNGTLDVYADDIGLGVRALLNAERQDVRDLASAINDRLIDQMSFAFILNEGEWNKDFDRFRISEADINRGDVSAVNYGASPYTSIEARASEWLADAERVSGPVAREAFIRLASRLEIHLPEAGRSEPAPEAERDDSGSAVAVVMRRYLALDER